MPRTVTFQGKQYVIPNGKTTTLRGQEKLPNGNWKFTKATYHVDGTRWLESRELRPEEIPGGPPPNKGASGSLSSVAMREYLEASKPKETPKVGLFKTGSRVYVARPNGPRTTGTVIDVTQELPLPPNRMVVCTDRSGHSSWVISEGDLEVWTGIGHAFLAAIPAVELITRQSNDVTFEGVPKHIGVVNPRAFEYDNVVFSSKCTGRVIHLDGDNTRVSWLSGVTSDSFYSHETESGTRYKKTFNVPGKYLKWCLLTNGGKWLRTWPGQGKTSQPALEVGTVVIYTGETPMCVSGDRRDYLLVKGTVLEVLDGERDCYTIRVLGGCVKEAWGLQTRIRRNTITKFDLPYIKKGTKVEISANISFKKNDLQGKRGVVILGTDVDGDVGIQFTEDLGAGSLDGQGKARHCLYVPASTVKVVSK